MRKKWRFFVFCRCYDFKQQGIRKLSSIFISLFKSTLNINPNTKLLKWYLMDFIDFLDEIEKARKKQLRRFRIQRT